MSPRLQVGKLEQLTIHGNDYPTRDGTGERDYIHVVDPRTRPRGGVETASTGCKVPRRSISARGIGSTVMEVVRAFEAACGPPNYRCELVRDVRGMCRATLLIRLWRTLCSTGAPSTTWSGPVQIRGDGRVKTPTVLELKPGVFAEARRGASLMQ